MRIQFKLLGIAGKRGSGKGSVASFLQELLPGSVSRQFGHELKLAAAVITGEPIETFVTQEGKAKILSNFGITAGLFLQRMGNCMRDGVMDDVWIRSYFKVLPDAPLVINESVRFPNEAEAIKARGGVVIRIEGDPLQQRGDGTRNDLHPSEVALDDYPNFDYVLHNTGTLDELREKVVNMLTKLSQS